MISPTDPAARYTASANSVAGYAYSANYLIDLTRRDASDLGLAAVDEETLVAGDQRPDAGGREQEPNERGERLTWLAPALSTGSGRSAGRVGWRERGDGVDSCGALGASG